MKIAICGSMVFAEKMVQIKVELEESGHQVFISQFAEGYLGKNEKDIEKAAIDDKNEHDAIRNYLEINKKSDAILVLNYDRKGIKNYIGGNTLTESGFAHVLNNKIFLMNPIPDIKFYRSEIEAVHPIALGQNLNNIY